MATFSCTAWHYSAHRLPRERQAFSFFFGVIIDLNLPAFISLKMFQIKWMNLRAAVEWILKGLCSPQETQYSWIHNRFYTLSTCSSEYDVSSLNVSRLWSSAEFRDALTYFAQADCILRSTAKVKDLMITAEDTFAGRSSLTELLKWWWTLLFYTSLHPRRVQSPHRIASCHLAAVSLHLAMVRTTLCHLQEVESLS